jgi:hypothetical protein
MPESLQWIKVRLAERGRKQRELAAAMALPYDRLNRYVNGLAPAPWDFESRVRRVLASWDAAQVQHAQENGHV